MVARGHLYLHEWNEGGELHRVAVGDGSDDQVLFTGGGTKSPRGCERVHMHAQHAACRWMHSLAKGRVKKLKWLQVREVAWLRVRPCAVEVRSRGWSEVAWWLESRGWSRMVGVSPAVTRSASGTSLSPSDRARLPY
eukprot:6416261-Prymnesium_polylepis.1